MRYPASSFTILGLLVANIIVVGHFDDVVARLFLSLFLILLALFIGIKIGIDDAEDVIEEQEGRNNRD
jgi:ABC-type proline/glycine betaine transport system permease subunit